MIPTMTLAGSPRLAHLNWLILVSSGSDDRVAELFMVLDELDRGHGDA